ncbi:Gfo/Idh/MocA family protein [Xanthocytophaga flava]|uniref:Gfo/Idh/MocA family protein n=1 Tax=Xanthocytophaga flava TaxID=3048013 RepID=UPI0028D90FEF|nr:Gfo/Idh/MocA family oxidoreductase [Xanthocytophaga flavus]MDJ1468051.1 Gfo/Idh/MocA family oxidoreductase [Xanthocytophaga flavus]
MQTIHWGIIGCGDVTELKSGPAFAKVADSRLVAVMRRDGVKAQDYARRHNVPKWYNDASKLIQDPEVNAIYIATPPDSHEHYALAAMEAGKPAYIEKPMTTTHAQAVNLVKASHDTNIKMVVAHYRRAQPYFKKIKSLLDEGAIGEVRFARLSFFDKPLSQEALQTEKIAWRVDPAISGGGLFHDLAPHQLDLAYYFFGDVVTIQGMATNQSKQYGADDIVSGSMLFQSGVLFEGLWCFTVDESETKDSFEIIGSEGKITFSVFGKQIIYLTRNGKESVLPFEAPTHVQQPMIEEVVSYFLGKGPNPCTASEGARIMEMIDKMTQK